MCVCVYFFTSTILELRREATATIVLFNPNWPSEALGQSLLHGFFDGQAGVCGALVFKPATTPKKKPFLGGGLKSCFLCLS